MGWTTLLMQGNLAPDAAVRAVTVIDRNARAQTKLIEDVLDVSRIVSGKLRLNVQALDLASGGQGGGGIAGPRRDREADPR